MAWFFILGVFESPPESPEPKRARTGAPFLPFGLSFETREKIHNKKKREVFVWKLSSDGVLHGGCTHCRGRSCVPLQEFGPKADAEITAGKAQRFKDALEEFAAAFEDNDLAKAEECLTTLKELRTAKCEMPSSISAASPPSATQEVRRT